jgi:hypothetical protein
MFSSAGVGQRETVILKAEMFGSPFMNCNHRRRLSRNFVAYNVNFKTRAFSWAIGELDKEHEAKIPGQTKAR